MHPNTFETALRGFIRNGPFRPFTVELVNGRQYVIEHPEALIFRDGRIAVYIAPDSSLTIFDPAGVAQVTGSPEPQPNASADHQG